MSAEIGARTGRNGRTSALGPSNSYQIGLLCSPASDQATLCRNDPRFFSILLGVQQLQKIPLDLGPWLVEVD